MKILLLVLFAPAMALGQANNYKNLVLEGAGVRGLAYAGVLSVLEENKTISGIEKVAGSSAGAIAGMMISVGYKAAEIDSIMMNLKVQKFMDGRGGILGKYLRFKKAYGIFKGDEFLEWLQSLIQHKTGNANLTFAQLSKLHQQSGAYKNFYCTGTNLSKQRLEIFSSETTPDMTIALAVRISSGVPIYFKPVTIVSKAAGSENAAAVDYYVDGGMLCNYPISLFDSCTHGLHNPLFCDQLIFNKHTLGIKMERPEQIDSLSKGNNNIPPYNINNVKTFGNAFGNLMMETLSRKYPGLSNELGRTIYVSQSNISPVVKKTKMADKKLLYSNGVTAAQQFFSSNPLP